MRLDPKHGLLLEASLVLRNDGSNACLKGRLARVHEAQDEGALIDERPVAALPLAFCLPDRKTGCKPGGHDLA